MDENPGDQLPEIVGKAIERFEAAHADREAALRAARLTISAIFAGYPGCASA